jgi:hypothetical protein
VDSDPVSRLLMHGGEHGGPPPASYWAAKEQVIYGRVFQNIQYVRLAVAAFIANYNQRSLVVIGVPRPGQARREYFQAIAA